jgi:hypothetical protein
MWRQNKKCHEVNNPTHVCQELYTSYKRAIHGQLTCRIRAIQVHSRPTRDLFATYQWDWRSIRAARELLVRKKSGSRSTTLHSHHSRQCPTIKSTLR